MIQTNGYVNQAQVMGNLTAKPELKVSKGNNIYCNFSVAVNRWNRTTKESDATYINMIAYGKTAEKIVQSFDKGDKILVQGTLSNNRYKDEEKGKQYDNTVITVDNFTYAGKKKADAERAIDEALAESKRDFSTFEDVEEEADMPF